MAFLISQHRYLSSLDVAPCVDAVEQRGVASAGVHLGKEEKLVQRLGVAFVESCQG